MDNSEERWIKLEQIVRKAIREELERFVEKHLRPELKDQLALFQKAPKVAFTNGKWTGVTETHLEAWRAAYPSCDVEVELKKAAGWIVSNPMLAPKTQFARFLNSWLARQQNALSIRSIPTRNEVPQKKKCSYCERTATGNPNRIDACDLHFMNAMHHEPVKAA